jgi:hypothetical protein
MGTRKDTEKEAELAFKALIGKLADDSPVNGYSDRNAPELRLSDLTTIFCHDLDPIRDLLREHDEDIAHAIADVINDSRIARDAASPEEAVEMVKAMIGERIFGYVMQSSKEYAREAVSSLLSEREATEQRAFDMIADDMLSEREAAAEDEQERSGHGR